MRCVSTCKRTWRPIGAEAPGRRRRCRITPLAEPDREDEENLSAPGGHPLPLSCDHPSTGGLSLSPRFSRYSAVTPQSRATFRHTSRDPDAGPGTSLRGYTAVVPPIPCSRVDPPVFFSQSVLRQPTGKSLDQTLDIARANWLSELRSRDMHLLVLEVKNVFRYFSLGEAAFSVYK